MAGGGTGAAGGPAAASSPGRRGWWIAGAACLIVALAAAVVLSLSHLGAPPPGCGPQSGCAKATASVWGRVPGLGWPTAFVGAAWYAGLLAGWFAGRGRLPRGAWWLAGLGGGASLLLIGVMVFEDALCPWCLASHAGNLGFLGVAVLTGSAARPQAAGRTAIAILAAAAITGGSLLVADAAATRRQDARDEATLAAAADSVIEAAAESAEESAEPAEAPIADQRTPSTGGGPPFTGRWRIGPERAAIRIVAFLDYQCPDCREVEGRLAAIVAARDDVSLSLKHFPFNPPCNRLARDLSFNPHPNACWAARAAEAAGILGGEEGFRRMHEELLARRGSFTDAELPGLAEAAGFEPGVFLRTMTAPLTLRRVEEDVEEGIALGLTATPTIFVNGVELGGWRVAGGLERTIQRLGEEGLPPRTAAEAGDRPPTAAEKFVDAWQTSRRIPGAALSREPGAAPMAVFGGEAVAGDRVVTVLVLGDLSDAQTRAVDARVQARVARDPRVRYVFRHVPLDPACNPAAVARRDTGGCLAARLAIAAGRLGGEEAARIAHRRLIAAPAPIGPSALVSVAEACGLEPAALAAAMADPATDAALAEDLADAARIGLGRRTVTVVVAGRIPARLEYDAIDLLQRTIDRAGAEVAAR
ncbi:MAG: DsbA family protein [Planctomycetota bacterium]|jgi:protein-disulfide isomerase